MNPSLHLVLRPAWRRALILLAGAAVAAPLAPAADEVVAVYARTWNGYVRTRQADGSFKPESFVFANGGCLAGREVDASLQNVPFLQVARTVAAPLHALNYVTSVDPKNTDLLIFVFWGTTNGPEGQSALNARTGIEDAFRSYQNFAHRMPGRPMGTHTPAGVQTFGPSRTASGPPPMLSDDHQQVEAAAADTLDFALLMNQMANDARDQENVRNARILGFERELASARQAPWFTWSQDIVAEIEQDRYYVVLKAYDFRARALHKQQKLLWEVRYSVPAIGNRFDEQLATMTKYAAHYFGEDTGRVLREPRPGRVEIGPISVVGN